MDDKVTLEDGKLVLSTRNGIWQARLPLQDGRYLFRSLKTSRREEAERAAIRLFHETQFKLTEGLPIHHRSFGSVIDEYVAFREKDNELGKQAKRGTSIKHTQDDNLRQIQRVAKFWREYAGARAIEAVDDKVLAAFVPWRKGYYHGKAELPRNARLNPTDKTLQWEVMLGKAVIKYAHGLGYRGNKPLPTFTFVPKVKRVRPAFNLADFGRLMSSLESYLRDSSNSQLAIRQLLLDYVKTLALSGMRVGEANSLRVRDIEPLIEGGGRSNVLFNVRGKTGARIVAPHVDIKDIVDAILQHRVDPAGEEYLFAMPDGTKIVTLSDQFNAFLIAYKLSHNSVGEKYTLYSLRHFYAIRAIARNVDIYTIARNMGTSVAIIEQYYAKHATTSETARRLGGETGVYMTKKTARGVPNLTDAQKLARNEKARERRARRKLEERGW